METQNIMKIKLDLPKIHKKPITQTQKINLKLNHLLKTHNPNPKSKSKYKLNGGRTLENRWERINHVSFDREGFLQIFEIGACGGELIWPWDKEEKRKGRKRRRCLWWKCNLTVRVKKWDQMKWRVLTIHGRWVEMRVKKWDQMKWDKYKRKRDKEHRKW